MEIKDGTRAGNVSYEAYKERLNRISPGLGNETPYYNLKGAYEGRLLPQLSSDGRYHLGSRNPNTGEILKKPGHETWDLMLEGEKEAGYEVYQEGDKWYSRKIENNKFNVREQLDTSISNNPKYEAMSKVLSQRNKSLNWVERGLNPDKYGKIDNEDGGFSTHRLAYRTGDNGEAYVYPRIIQNDKGELEQLDDDAAWEYARKTKTAMVVPDVKLAEYYSQNGLIKHQ